MDSQKDSSKETKTRDDQEEKKNYIDEGKNLTIEKVRNVAIH
jgi:hypothetical protein